jgi:transposase-like protein
MAGRASYSEQDKARVFLALAANDGNVKRTARETGVPETTVRNFKREFEDNPPSQELVRQEFETGDYVAELETLRKELSVALRRKIPDMTGHQLAVSYGIIDDKLTRARGLATSRTEHVHTLPSAEELALAGQMLATGAIEAARQRQAELAESNVRREQPALPSGL